MSIKIGKKTSRSGGHVNIQNESEMRFRENHVFANMTIWESIMNVHCVNTANMKKNDDLNMLNVWIENNADGSFTVKISRGQKELMNMNIPKQE